MRWPAMRSRGVLLTAVAIIALAVVLSSRQSAAPVKIPSRPDGGAGGVVATQAQDASASGPLTCPRRVLSTMSLAQRVGQLFVAGVSSTSPSRPELRAIRRLHLGGVILTGHNDIGVTATRRVTRELQAQATKSTTNGVRLWVSVDQEGGYVQVLNGAGFASIPTALSQGRLVRSALRSKASTWGGQLNTAGVNLDLAPVMDTVPKSLGTANLPVGFYDREYGHHPKPVARHGTAFNNGMEAGGVQTTAKHFPGLGRVRRNTDLSANVTDKVTTRHDRFLRPFRAAIEARVPVVMVSLARYTRIDRRHLAAFSTIVLRGLLRRDLGFTGVIMSDSMTAVAVQHIPVALRGLRFLRAGGTVVLSVTTATTRTMAAAVLRWARSHPHFRRVTSRDALTVLRVKHRNGMLPC